MNEETQLNYFHYHSSQLLLGRIEFAVAPSTIVCSYRCAECQLQSSCQYFEKNCKAKSVAHGKETNNPLGMRETLEEAFWAIERQTSS